MSDWAFCLPTFIYFSCKLLHFTSQHGLKILQDLRIHLITSCSASVEVTWACTTALLVLHNFNRFSNCRFVGEDSVCYQQGWLITLVISNDWAVVVILYKTVGLYTMTLWFSVYTSENGRLLYIEKKIMEWHFEIRTTLRGCMG